MRIALVATPESMMRLVMAEGAKLALAGLAIGLALAFFLRKVVEGLLFGATARDPFNLLQWPR